MGGVNKSWVVGKSRGWCGEAGADTEFRKGGGGGGGVLGNC